MGVLFKQSDLEIRFAMNLNVLNAKGVPGVMGLRDLLLEWLDHRKEVLVRKSRFRLDKIEARLEILDGYLIAYLNLDEVIRIIREEDEPKTHLMKTFDLSDVQAEAILNMRLRALRKLEEQTIRTEHKELVAERKGLKSLLKSDDMQWKSISTDIRKLKKKYGLKTDLGKRRSTFGEAMPEMDVLPEILVEKEPVTIILSQKGWIRSMKGHAENGKDIKYKTGDQGKFVLHAQTTDKLVLFATNGRAYVLQVSKLPGGRGNGEPLSLMIDLEAGNEVVEIFVYDEARKLLVASRTGNGFVVAESELFSTRRAGKQILNVSVADEAICCVPATGDSIAVLGENRKLLIFPLADLPEMGRGKGVRLQKYNEGGLADVRSFKADEGLIVSDRSGRSRVFEDLTDWQGTRAQAGRIRPKGFPSDGLMGPAFKNKL